MTVRFFYDIPVYRIPEETYEVERAKFVDQILSPESDGTDRPSDYESSIFRVVQEDFLRRYGAWRFNEIIGYVRLYFIGSQIRGEYCGVDRIRIVRSRRKIFQPCTLTLCPEIDLSDMKTNQEILDAIRDYIDECRLKLEGRYLDTTVFEQICEHVNWMSVAVSGGRRYE